LEKKLIAIHVAVASYGRIVVYFFHIMVQACAFSIAAPKAWNSPPTDLGSIVITKINWRRFYFTNFIQFPT